MKNNIPPVYECEENRNGGAVSWRIYINDDRNKNLIAHILTQVMVNAAIDNIFNIATMNSQVHCVYLAPKLDGAVIKIWIKNYDDLKNNINNLSSDIKTLMKPYRLQFSKHKNLKDNSNYIKFKSRNEKQKNPWRRNNF